jgi:hypothetical protein
MIKIDETPCVSIKGHEVEIVLDKVYKLMVYKETTKDGYTYSVESDLLGDEKRIVEGSVLKHVNTHGIKN